MGGVSVATWLASLPLTDPPTAVELQELRADLDHSVTTSCRAVRAHLDVDLLPARVPKSRLADLQRCERSALARFRDVAPAVAGDAVLRGTALDQFVAHQLTAGRVREPVADLTSMLSAAGDWSSLAVLDDMDLVEAAALLEPMAAAVAASWSGIDPAWAPRVECRASVVLADGACVCSGVVDVELGGVTTDRPGVLVEVKSGRAAASHQDEVYLYALLVALRDGVAPGVVARWYPGADPTGLPVTLGVLEAAARRLADGVRRWFELLAGDPATERAGAWCTWCPDLAVCPSASAEGAGVDERTDLAHRAEDDDGW